VESAFFSFYSYAQRVNKLITLELGNFLLQVNKNGAILKQPTKPTDQINRFSSVVIIPHRREHG